MTGTGSSHSTLWAAGCRAADLGCSGLGSWQPPLVTDCFCDGLLGQKGVPGGPEGEQPIEGVGEGASYNAMQVSRIVGDNFAAWSFCSAFYGKPAARWREPGDHLTFARRLGIMTTAAEWALRVGAHIQPGPLASRWRPLCSDGLLLGQRVRLWCLEQVGPRWLQPLLRGKAGIGGRGRQVSHARPELNCHVLPICGAWRSR